MSSLLVRCEPRGMAHTSGTGLSISPSHLLNQCPGPRMNHTHQLASNPRLFCCFTFGVHRCWQTALPGAAVPPRVVAAGLLGSGCDTAVVSASTCKTLHSIYIPLSLHEEGSRDLGPGPRGRQAQLHSSLRCHRAPHPLCLSDMVLAV